MDKTPEEKLSEDLNEVGKALNIISNRARLLGIELDITTYSNGRIDLELKREIVDFNHIFVGFDKTGLTR